MVVEERPTSAIAFLCLLGALAVLAIGGASATGSAFPGGNGRIAYASDQDGSWDVYSMNADGSGKRRLTSGPGDSTQPAFSADGQRIAFASNRAGNWDIYAMNADGSGITRLTNDPGADTQPTFSPDGARIAFIGKRGTSWYGHVYTMNADGTDQVRLIEQFGSEERPTFSPDGRTIALGSIVQKNRHIVTMTSTGGELTVLTHGAFDDRQPSFSPGGGRIAFSSRRDGNAAIFSMRADGSGVTKLTGGLPSQMPAYSPDGSEIAFVRGGKIYAMTAGGNAETRLTRERGTQAWPTWQPLLGQAGGGGGGASGSFRIGRPILDRRHGTARLPVTVTAAGTLSLRGKGVRPVAGKAVAAGATAKLAVRPKRKLASLLGQKGRARVKVLVTFTARSGGADTKAKKLVLVKKR